MMRQYYLAAFMLAGCAVINPLSQHGTLVVKPQFENQYTAKATVNPYSQSDISQLVLKIFTFDGSEHDQGIQRTLLNAQLDNPIAFSNLKPNTTYRIKAYAYTSGSLIISDESSSSTDILLTNDDRPSVATLSVKLVDRTFNGQATSSLALNPGGYTPQGSESLRLKGLEGIVTTIAGNGVATFSEGVGTSASFSGPRDLAVDALGNVYVADRDNYRIRKITPAGVVTTIAGNGTVGLVDGTASRISCPVGIWAKANGAIYFTDRDNNCVRKIVDGVVSTIAGNGTVGFVDGTASAARFNYPRGIVMDASGNLFIAEAYNHCIRKIDANAVATVFVGNGTAGFLDGTGTAALFNIPADLAIDSQGNLFVADTGNQRIRKITPNRVVTTIAGNGYAGYVDGISTNSVLNTPFGVTVDSYGNVYFTEDVNNRVRQISPQGLVTTVAGKALAGAADGTGLNAGFAAPAGLDMDASGNLYIADSGANLIRKVR